jgi:hypothetical protein
VTSGVSAKAPLTSLRLAVGITVVIEKPSIRCCSLMPVTSLTMSFCGTVLKAEAWPYDNV